jgi:hypothetical protein
LFTMLAPVAPNREACAMVKKEKKWYRVQILACFCFFAIAKMENPEMSKMKVCG